jgi:hypothetical protein
MYRDPCRVDDAGPKVVQFLNRVRDQNANPTSPLNRYIEGWAQTTAYFVGGIGELIGAAVAFTFIRCDSLHRPAQ